MAFCFFQDRLQPLGVLSFFLFFFQNARLFSPFFPSSLSPSLSLSFLSSFLFSFLFFSFSSLFFSPSFSCALGTFYLLPRSFFLQIFISFVPLFSDHMSPSPGETPWSGFQRYLLHFSSIHFWGVIYIYTCLFYAAFVRILKHKFISVCLTPSASRSRLTNIHGMNEWNL